MGLGPLIAGIKIIEMQRVIMQNSYGAHAKGQQTLRWKWDLESAGFIKPPDISFRKIIKAYFIVQDKAYAAVARGNYLLCLGIVYLLKVQ